MRRVLTALRNRSAPTRLSGAERQLRAQAARAATVHALVVLIYATGLAISRVPFTSPAAHTIATSPLVPVAHAAAALLLLVAIITGRGKGTASVVSFAVMLSYAAMIIVAARLRQPPLGLAAAPFLMLAIMAGWHLIRHWGLVDALTDPQED